MASLVGLMKLELCVYVCVCVPANVINNALWSVLWFENDREWHFWVYIYVKIYHLYGMGSRA